MAAKKSFKNVFQEATSKFITSNDQQNEENEDNKVGNYKEEDDNTTLQQEPPETIDINIMNEPLAKDNSEPTIIKPLSEEALVVDDGKIKERLNLSFLKEDIDYMNIMMRLDNIKFVTHYISKLIQEDKMRRAEEFGMAVKLFKI